MYPIFRKKNYPKTPKKNSSRLKSNKRSNKESHRSSIKMSFEIGIFVLFRVIPIMLHSVGLYLLVNVRYMKRYQKIQGIYLMWLSITEITMNLSKIVIKLTSSSSPDFSHILNLVRTGFFSTQVVLVLSAMTVDRLMFVRLNLRYKLKLATRATKLVIIFSVIFCVPVTLAMFLTQSTSDQLSDTKLLYYWPINDTFVMIVFMICYTNMIYTINKKSKKLYGCESIMYKNRMQKATLVPKLIVTSFFVFWMVGDLIYFGYRLADKAVPFWAKTTVNIMVCTAYSTDAVFYIYFCRPVRRVLNKKFMWKKKRKDVCVISGARVATTSDCGKISTITSSF